MFELLYKSPWHHPAVALIVASVMFVVLLRKLPFFWAFVIGALTLTCTDAVVTGGWSQLGGEQHWLYTPLTFIFVLTGDWRAYLLSQRYSSSSQKGWAPWISSLSWAMVPTLLSGVLSKVLFPEAFANPRILYAVYELIFIATMAIYTLQVLPARLRHCPDDVAKWIKIVLGFQITHYILWVSADFIILAGFDFGHGLRIIPNVMYYAGFVPVVYFLAPKSIKQPPEISPKQW